MGGAVSGARARTLLADLEARGLRLKVSGDRLLYRPIAAMTEDLAARVREVKPDLLAVVRRAEAEADPFTEAVLDAFPGEVVDPESPPGWEDAVPIEVEYFDPATWAIEKPRLPGPRRWKNEGVVNRQEPSLFGEGRS
jgi:hypothetical protein